VEATSVFNLETLSHKAVRFLLGHITGSIMGIIAALIYWIIVALWMSVFVVLGAAFVRSSKRFGAISLLLVVLAIDTMRNVIENVYFGLYFGSRYGIFPSSIGEVLGAAHLLIIPKIVNIFAACAVLGLLLFRCLPKIMKERRDAEHSLNQAEWKFQLLVDGVSEYAIYLLDPSGKVISWNSGAERIKGYKASEIIGQHVETFYTHEDRRSGRPGEALEIAKRTGRFETKAWRLRKDGSRFRANVVIDSIRDRTGKLVGFAKVTKDITESQQAEERLIQLAHYDQLTGLPNRVSLMKDVRAALDQPSASAVLVMLDLDGFKAINDIYGHPAGDRVLEEVADRSREIIPPGTQFYRLGGDEFVLLMPGERDPLKAAGIVNEMLRRFEEPIEVDRRRLLVSASAGIAIAPNDGRVPADLLAHADLALYEAKGSGGRRYSLFVPSMRAKIRARQELDNQLRQACAKREFILYYQPQIRLSDGALVGAEALLRWRHPERGLVAPTAFIEALAENPLALEVGNWILRTACSTAAHWRRRGLGDLRIGINLFPVQFNDHNLLLDVEAALQESGLPASALELEITENIAFGHDERLLTTLRALRAKGVGLAFDDFGTGYASLSYLTKYPLTRIKIDRSFVRNIAKKCPQQATAIVRSMIVMAHNLGFEVIAEGVETADQAAFLQTKRCDEAQGYLYAPPLSEKEFDDFLRNHSKKRTPRLAS
jgi:diguanylate cyclase (GGDEF)-like protein/PAS domain S-box-containing protein